MVDYRRMQAMGGSQLFTQAGIFRQAMALYERSA
jgi:hypothetical protein